MASVKSFYAKRIQHHFLSDALKQIQNDDPESADVVIIGPATGGEDSDLENEDDKILNTTGLREEIAREVEIFNIRNDEIERMTSDGEDSDVETPPANKQKQNAKKSKINMKRQKQYIQTQTFSSFDHNKNAQAVFLENPGLVDDMYFILESSLSSH